MAVTRKRQVSLVDTRTITVARVVIDSVEYISDGDLPRQGYFWKRN